MNNSFFYTKVLVFKSSASYTNHFRSIDVFCPYSVNLLVWMKTQLIMITPTLEFAPINYGMEF
jgi:hypothetical protein